MIEGDAPQSALGYLIQGLSEVKAKGNDPFTVMSCDNLQGNGVLTKRLTVQYARLVDPSLADWIE